MAESRLCSIDGCCKPVRAKEWCVTHYHRWKRTGDALKTPQRQGGKNRVDIAGQTFGQLVAIEPLSPSTPQGVKWRCVCECGREAAVLAKKLRNGHAASCGQHKNVTHGKSKSPEYMSWQAMRDRCANPKNVMFHRYGGRGIAVCARWASFDLFLSDLGPRPAGHSLDRVDVNGNYEPGNCRWATKLQQDNNRSTSRIVEVSGLRGSVYNVYQDIVPRPAVSLKLVRHRLSSGWNQDDAFYLPSRKGLHYSYRIT